MMNLNPKCFLIGIGFLGILTTMGIASVGAVPREEHPRPDFWRDQWMNLNGDWEFAFDPQNKGEAEEWYVPGKPALPQRIVVPYPWESSLSQIQKTDYKGVAWYQRKFTIPKEWAGKNIFLNFGAVDWAAKVWIDGKVVGEHEGGYTPFAFHINQALSNQTEHVLTVKVTDATDPEHPTGKQIGWYTTTSGIWQTVYLEARGESDKLFIEDLLIKTQNNGRVEVSVSPNIPSQSGLNVRVLPDTPPDNAGSSETIDEKWVKSGSLAILQIPNPKLWSPDSPTLYFVKVQLLNDDKVLDTVHTYFGIREVTHGKFENQPYESIQLNGKPLYILGALNQAFHPEGIYTYPSNEIIRQDLEDTRSFGWNNLRLHIKVDEPRFYYWADRLGVTILYDLPSFHKYTDEAKRTYELTLRQAMQRDKNHPAILAWVLFNETWGLQKQKTAEGQAWVKQMVALAKSLDTTRLVEDNSPCEYDHIVTDINSWHFYIYPHAKARQHVEEVVQKTFPGSGFNYLPGYKQGTEPLINSEYGGVNAGMGDRDISWCFHYLTQELRRYGKIGGYIYTELMDIEWEHNGFMNYDRSKKVFGYEEFVPVPSGQPPFTYCDLNNTNFLILDAIAGEDISGSEQKSVPTALSLYSGHPGGKLTLNWQLYQANRWAPNWRQNAEGKSIIVGKPYEVTSGEPIQFKVGPNQLYLLYAWIVDDAGKLVARNFWTFHSFKNEDPAVEKEGKVIHWNPTKYASVKGKVEEPRCKNPNTVSIPGEASITYKVPLPKTLDLSKVAKVVLQGELAACAGKERVDWKQTIKAPCTPQTDVKNQFPSKIKIQVNGVTLPEITLPNDPADYRGILSNIFDSAPPSSYGYWQNVEIPVSALQGKSEAEIVIQTCPNTQGGLRIFGSRSGRFPVDPTLIFE